LRRWKNTSRLFKNTVTAEATKIERESTTGKFEEVAPFVSGKRGRQVFLNGDKDYGVWTAGQVIGLIHNVPTCQDLVNRIEKEAIETLSSASSLIVDKQPEPDIAGKPLGDTTSDPRSDHNKKVPGEAQIYDIGKSKL
ncbi:hypothetical protein KC352_g33511, partial [Hortaea werneckii]